MTRETLELLVRARERIAVPERWQQGSLGDFSSDVAPVCARGALLYACMRIPRGDRRKAELLLVEGVKAPGWLSFLNDTGTHTEVLAKFDRAITYVEDTIAGLDGPSRRIVIEPAETPVTAPVEEPAYEPVEEPAPERREREPVPA